MHYEAGPIMTPLVDVVMVILIFLMLAGSFGVSERFLASQVPIHGKGTGGVPPPPGWTPPIQLNVRVADNGNAGLVGERGQFTDPEALRQALIARVNQFKAEGRNVKDVEVVLFPGENTKWEHLLPLYDASLRAGVEKVAFAQTGATPGR